MMTDAYNSYINSEKKNAIFFTFIDNFCDDVNDFNFMKKIYNALFKYENGLNYIFLSLNFKNLENKGKFNSEFNHISEKLKSHVERVQFANLNISKSDFLIKNIELLLPIKIDDNKSQEFKNNFATDFYIPENVFSMYSLSLDIFIRDFSLKELSTNVTLPLLYQNKKNKN
ncbi:hypothetical protein GVAV_000729 [Gurleya vavrai]